MPRYFFHVRSHEGFSEDHEGTEFKTDALARIEAVQSAREMMAEKILKGEIIDGEVFEIVREDGSLVEVLPFRSVVRLD